MKAAPLLRAWLHRLRAADVRFHMRHRWLGCEGGVLQFATSDGIVKVGAGGTATSSNNSSHGPAGGATKIAVTTAKGSLR
jgi:predicted flavoprotein YhiN